MTTAAPSRSTLPPAYRKNQEPPSAVGWEWWTPAMAMAEVGKMHPDQRAKRAKKVEEYRRAMNEHRWTECYDAIVRDASGRWVNGQHRLFALAEADIPGIWLLTAQTDDRAAMGNMDRGLIRSEANAMKMCGAGDYGGAEIATVKAMVEGAAVNTRRWGISDLAEAMEAHGATVSTVFAETRAPGITRGVRAAVCRAYLVEDQDRVMEFCRVLTSGMPVSANPQNDQAAVCLRNLLIRQTGQGSRMVEIERYRKTQAALQAFLRRQPMTKIYGAGRELWPLDTDQEDGEA